MAEIISKYRTDRRAWRMIQPRKRGGELENRISNGESMLLALDIIVVDQIQRYAKKLKDYCMENGLYRQEIKKHVNAICTTIDQLYKQILQIDYIKFSPMWRYAYPHFVDSYLTEGGGLVTKLQVAYNERWDNEVDKLFWTEMQVLSYNKAARGELLSIVFVIHRVSQICEQIFTRVNEEMYMDKYGFIINEMKCRLPLHKELQHNSRFIWSKFKGTDEDFKSTDYLEGSIKNVISHITLHLVGIENLRLLTDTMAVAMQEYVDYALARIRMMQVTGTYDDSAMDHLVAVCGANLTNKLLSELSEVAVEDDADTFDVMANMLPLSDTPTALNRARKLFFDKMFIE